MRNGNSGPVPLGRSILLVEEHLPKREQLYDLFTRHGCTVIAVQSGELAISALKHARPDVVVADAQLPDMSGWALAEQIRAFDARVPLILYGRSHMPPGPVGATLKLRAFLPYDVDDQALLVEVRRAAEPEKPVRPERWPGHVLVVDDEPKLREVLKGFLEMHGFTVQSAGSGEEALAHLPQHGFPAVVLLDIQMPGMDGLLTLKKLKALRPQLPVIMLTGLEDGQAMEEARSLGAYDYILKPFNLDYLETVLLSKILTGTPAEQP